MLQALRTRPLQGLFQLGALVRRRPLSALLVAALAAWASAAPEDFGRGLAFSAESLLGIAPIIGIGILLTAYVLASGASEAVARVFTGHPLRMVLLAAAVGALTPVCGLTVLPLVAGLMSAGVPLAPIMAFWLASPITDPAMLAVTAATLGPAFALGKTLSAFAIGLAGGAVVALAASSGALTAPMRPRARLPVACRDGGTDTVELKIWRDRERLRRMGRVAVDTAGLMALWLGLAFLGEYLIRAVLPVGPVAGLVGEDSPFAIPLAALVGAPIYLDGYAALPLIRGLMDAGMAPGAAMCFLVAGGIVSVHGAVPVFFLVRLPIFLLYLLLAVSGSMAAGWLFGLGLSVLP
jgi:uncharacterized membrane protein YraQ (UPF0718 family)